MSHTPDAPREQAAALRERARIRRQASSRKSVQEGTPDRLADQLDAAADTIERLCAPSEMEPTCAPSATAATGEFVSVPREPTWEMCEAAIKAAGTGYRDSENLTELSAEKVWEAMLAAAPVDSQGTSAGVEAGTMPCGLCGADVKLRPSIKQKPEEV